MSGLDLSESQATFPSDSETYDANLDSPHSSSDVTPSTGPRQPMILYSPPTIWSIFRGAAINLILPFVNGLMLGFGELFAHEAAFRLGWSKTKVCWQTDVAGRAERGSLHRSSRSSQRIAMGTLWDQELQSEMIPAREEHGAAKKWTCGRQWSRWSAGNHREWVFPIAIGCIHRFKIRPSRSDFCWPNYDPAHSSKNPYLEA
jgi:hypothetical protein